MDELYLVFTIWWNVALRINTEFIEISLKSICVRATAEDRHRVAENRIVKDFFKT